MASGQNAKEKDTLLGRKTEDAEVISTSLISAVLVAATAQFLVGYNTGVMNAPHEVVFPEHTTLIWAVAVASFAMGGPFGANVAGSLAESQGRRGAIVINTWIFLMGGILQTVAQSMITITVSRFIIGFASGFSSVVVPIYLGEIAPPKYRGTLGTMTQFALVVGILAADVLAFPFATPDPGWRFLFAATPVIALIQLFMSPLLLESPRWLLGADKNSEEARKNIKKLRGFSNDQQVDTVVNNYVAAFEAQNAQDEETLGKVGSKATLSELFRDKNVRLFLVSAIVLQLAQQLCGINAVFYYSTMFFEGITDNELMGTTLVGAVNVLATAVALFLMDSCGRRTLILWSSGGMLVSCVVIVLSLLEYFHHMMALVAVNVYVSFFEIGLGPIPWLIVAEMFDARYLSIAMAVSCQINWASNIVIGLVFPYFVEYLGAYSFVPFAVVLSLTFIFALIWLPETHGTTPEQLQAEVLKKNAGTEYKNPEHTIE